VSTASGLGLVCNRLTNVGWIAWALWPIHPQVRGELPRRADVWSYKRVAENETHCKTKYFGTALVDEIRCQREFAGTSHRILTGEDVPCLPAGRMRSPTRLSAGMTNPHATTELMCSTLDYAL
jgi:hypothetical protein